MTVVLLLHPGKGLLSLRGLSLDGPLHLSLLGLLSLSLEGVPGGEILRVNLVSSKCLLNSLDSLADGRALVLNAGLDLDASLVSLWGSGPLGFSLELVVHLSLLASSSVLELLLNLDLHLLGGSPLLWVSPLLLLLRPLLLLLVAPLLLLLLVPLFMLVGNLVVSFNTSVSLLWWVASLKDGFLDRLELSLVRVQLLGSIVGGVSTGEPSENLALLLSASSLGLLLLLRSSDSKLGNVLECVLLALTDVLHFGRLLGRLNGFLLSYNGDSNSGLLVVVILLVLLLGGGVAVIVLSSSSGNVDGVGWRLVKVQVKLSSEVSGQLTVSVLLWLILFPGVLKGKTNFLTETLLGLLWVAGGSDWGNLNGWAFWDKSLVEGAGDLSCVWHTLDLGNTDLSFGLSTSLDVGRGDGEFKSTAASDLSQSAEWELNGGPSVNSRLELLSEEGNLDGEPGVVADGSNNPDSSLSLHGLTVVCELGISEFDMGGDEKRSLELLGHWETHSVRDFLGEFRKHKHLLGGDSVLGESFGELFLNRLSNVFKGFLVDLDDFLDVVEDTDVQESLHVLDVSTVLDGVVEVDKVKGGSKGDNGGSALSKADFTTVVEVGWDQTGVGTEVGEVLEEFKSVVLDFTGLVQVVG